MFIYIITNDVNNKAYIGLHFGQDLESRWKAHQWSCLRSETVLAHAMRKYGPDKFHITSIWSGFVSQQGLKRLERYYIRSLGTKSPNGYNLTEGGDGAPGFRHSDEERQRRREKMVLQLSSGNIRSLKGQKLDPAVCRKISIALTGRKRPPTSEETRVKMSKTRMGKKKKRGYKLPPEATTKRLASRAGFRHSEATIRKMRESQRGHAGHLRSPETRAKMSASHVGFRHTEESKRKMGEVKRARNAERKLSFKVPNQ